MAAPPVMRGLIQDTLRRRRTPEVNQCITLSPAHSTLKRTSQLHQRIHLSPTHSTLMHPSGVQQT